VLILRSFGEVLSP